MNDLITIISIGIDTFNIYFKFLKFVGIKSLPSWINNLLKFIGIGFLIAQYTINTWTA